jgi:hypothetical protein
MQPGVVGGRHRGGGTLNPFPVDWQCGKQRAQTPGWVLSRILPVLCHLNTSLLRRCVVPCTILDGLANEAGGGSCRVGQGVHGGHGAGSPAQHGAAGGAAQPGRPVVQHGKQRHGFLHAQLPGAGSIDVWCSDT